MEFKDIFEFLTNKRKGKFFQNKWNKFKLFYIILKSMNNIL